LCLIKHHAMKTYWWREDIVPRLLNLALHSGEWSVSRPGHFIPGKRFAGTYWTGGEVGRGACMDTVTKRKNPYPCRKTNLSRPAPSLVTILTELRQSKYCTDCSTDCIQRNRHKMNTKQVSTSMHVTRGRTNQGLPTPKS